MTPAVRCLLVANRGEIAARIVRTARRLGLRTVAVYSDADRDAPHVSVADAAVRIGTAAPGASYLSVDALVNAAHAAGADAVHPGYGFLAESAGFAQAVLDAGLTWIGPPPAAIAAMGDKSTAKQLARTAGAPVLPGYDGDDDSDATLARAAGTIGFPLMVKARAGGGGRGMRLVQAPADLPAALASARSEAAHAFGDGRLLLERAVERARHVEVQIFADAHGGCVHLGERDCSVQRRHQKLIEEAPSPAVDTGLRDRMGAAAIAVARAAGYVNAGTVEFLLDAEGAFWFMEMNTRLQVEHPVTECVTGLDLVEWQLRVAAGERLPLAQDAIRIAGHAIEARLCAERAGDHLPQSGVMHVWQPCDTVRVDHALTDGARVPPDYDSMIAKLIAHAPTRDGARARLARALDATVALGVETNQRLLAAILRDPAFAAGPTTALLEGFSAPVPDAEHQRRALTIAAVLRTERAARDAGFGEWASWSTTPERAMWLRLRVGDTAGDVHLRFADGCHEVSVGGATERLRVRAFDGRTLRLAPVGGGADLVCTWHAAGERLFLGWDGNSCCVEDLRAAPPQRTDASGAVRGLAAPMNGRVVAVHTVPGARVAAGEALVVLEAMKMEHVLAAPAAATVGAVHVAPGHQVAPGRLLIEFSGAE